MSGAVEYGKCEICGEDGILSRTYFIYPVDCTCCGCTRQGQNRHFEMIRHCNKCQPSIPKEINPLLIGMDGKDYCLNIKNIKPIEIDGDYDDK